MNFQNWINDARLHWQEFLPTKYKELKENGKLDEALAEVAELTFSELNQLEESGYQHQDAWEMVRENYLFPPEEAGLEEDEEGYSEGLLLLMEAQSIANLATRLAGDPDLEWDEDLREKWK